MEKSLKYSKFNEAKLTQKLSAQTKKLLEKTTECKIKEEKLQKLTK